MCRCTGEVQERLYAFIETSTGIHLPPFTGLNIRIPNIIPVKGSGFIDQGSWLFNIRGVGGLNTLNPEP